MDAPDSKPQFAEGDTVVYIDGERASQFLYHPENLLVGKVLRVIEKTTYEYEVDFEDTEEDGIHPLEHLAPAPIGTFIPA